MDSKVYEEDMVLAVSINRYIFQDSNIEKLWDHTPVLRTHIGMFENSRIKLESIIALDISISK